MKRELKFRAWDSVNKVMELNIHHLDSLNEILHKEKYNVMQFTGLKDKEGNEIYEGDILEGISNNEFSKGDINNYEVIWGQDSWHIIGTWFSLQELINYCNNKVKVIGNIYETPKLHWRHS